jgi:hypothetical protein
VLLKAARKPERMYESHTAERAIIPENIGKLLREPRFP